MYELKAVDLMRFKFCIIYIPFHMMSCSREAL